MRKILFNIVAFSLFIIMIGCNETDIVNSRDGGEGVLELDITKSSAIQPVNGETEDVIFDTPNIEDFKIIINDSNGEQCASFPKFSDMPEATRLKSGSYTLVASYGTNQPIGFDSPYYVGSSPFTIESTLNTQMSVTSKISNVLMSISYTEAFKTVFKDYTLEVMTPHTVNEDGQYEALRFIGDDKRVAFIKEADIVYLALNVTKTSNDKTFRYGVAPIENAKGGEYYNLLFDTDIRGEATVSITLSDATNSKSVDVELGSDFLPKDAPAINTTFDTSVPYVFRYGLYDNSPIVAVFKAEGGIKNIVMNIDSQYALTEGVPATIDFSNISEEVKIALENIGIEWSEDMVGRKNTTIKFTNMLSSLKPHAAVSLLENKFSFTLIDSYDRDAKSDFTIAVKPLNIQMNGFNDYDVWSDRATVGLASMVDLTPEELLQIELKYEISEDGELWSDLTHTITGGTTLISDLKDNTTYSVRATAKSVCSEPLVFTTEEAKNLPNASFEEYYTEKFNSGKMSNRYYPYAVGEVEPFWQTLNPMTTGDGRAEYYKSYPVAMVTSDASHGSYAIRVETVGWGSDAKKPGLFGTIPRPEYTTPGKFFIGDYVEAGDSDHGSANMAQGKPFTSRPTSINFDYKFATYNTILGSEMQVYATLENRDGGSVTVLARGEFKKESKDSGSGASYATQKIDLAYENLTMKATHISLSFQSQEMGKNIGITELWVNDNDGGQSTIGAWLIVDNIVLGY